MQKTVSLESRQRVDEALYVPWHFNVKRPTYALDTSLMLESDCGDLATVTGRAYSQSLAVHENGVVSYYVPEPEVADQLRFWEEQQDMVGRILQQLPHDGRRIREAVDGLQRQVAKQPASAAAFQDFFARYRHFVTYRVLTRVLGYSEHLPEDYLAHLARMRMDFKALWMGIRESLAVLWQRVGAPYGAAGASIMSLTAAEFLAQLNEGSFGPSRLACRERRELCIVLRVGSSEQVLVGSTARRFMQKVPALSETPDAAVQELRGQVASRGYARGPVRVMLQPQPVPAEERFVVVTSMTTPDFVPLLTQAVAIVTDEGGLTSHAAIISRELNKPCIIGTKVATKVLKDGDMVEVDADKGVVRVVRRVG